MVYEGEIKSELISLRAVELSDCNETYLAWLQDPDVNKYLETRWEEQSVDKIKDFVLSVRESDHSYLFAILYNYKHVGNIKIGPIHAIYKFADISIFIGEKAVWGKRIGSEAIRLVTSFGFDVLHLNRLQSGCVEGNIATDRFLKKNGYTLEAVYRKKVFVRSGDPYVDCHMYAILYDDYMRLGDKK